MVPAAYGFTEILALTPSASGMAMLLGLDGLTDLVERHIDLDDSAEVVVQLVALQARRCDRSAFADRCDVGGTAEDVIVAERAQPRGDGLGLDDGAAHARTIGHEHEH